MVELSTKLAGIPLRTPLIIAGGVMKEKLVLEAMEHEIGGVVVGTYSLSPKSRHPPPFITRLEHGFVNAYGIRHSIKEAEGFILKVVERAERDQMLVIGSVIESTVEKTVEAAVAMKNLGVSIIELNVSAPVLKDGLRASKRLVEEVKRGAKSKVSVKFPPLTSISLDEVKGSNADILHLTNAVAPALIIDYETGRPFLRTEDGCGALSGRALKPLSLASVLLASKALPRSSIIGTGGVSSWEDVIEFIMVGASAVGLHSILYEKGAGVIDEIIKGVRNYLERKGVSSIGELKGLTREYLDKGGITGRSRPKDLLHL